MPVWIVCSLAVLLIAAIVGGLYATFRLGKSLRARLIGNFVAMVILVWLAWVVAEGWFFSVHSFAWLFAAHLDHPTVIRGMIDDAYSGAKVSALVFALVITGLTALAGWVITRRIMEGCRTLQEGANHFASGNLHYKISSGRRDEFGRLADHFNDMASKLATAQDELKRQQELAESLLLNVLPKEVANELKEKGAVAPRYHEDVTILFTDFKGFTLSTEKLAADELVRALHEYFTAFDSIASFYGLEKLKTIGDSYMAVAGLPKRSSSHSVDAVLAAFELVNAVQRQHSRGLPPWQVRIGVHTGPVVSGVVGIRKFAYDIWGESVNFASRMESSGHPDRINLSASTYNRVKDFFECEYRGKVRTKEDREFDMYFALGPLASLNKDSLATRYKTYFQRDLPGYPFQIAMATSSSV